jgi:hypothetical protein
VDRPAARDAREEEARGDWRDALARQQTGEDHDLGLIVERLAWTPEQRLDANEAFLRLDLAARPGGPLLDDE